MKNWELIYMDENGKPDFEGCFTHFRSNNPLRFIKKFCGGYNTKKGFIFRQWKKVENGKRYFDGNWYKGQNGSFSQITVIEEREK